jgi:hypothetical protein
MNGVAYQSSGCVDAECSGVCAVEPCRLGETEEAVGRHVDSLLEVLLGLVGGSRALCAEG